MLMNYSTDSHVSQYYNGENSIRGRGEEGGGGGGGSGAGGDQMFSMKSNDYFSQDTSSSGTGSPGASHDMDDMRNRVFHHQSLPSNNDSISHSLSDSNIHRFDGVGAPNLHQRDNFARNDSNRGQDFSSSQDYSSQEGSYSYRNLVASGPAGISGGARSFVPQTDTNYGHQQQPRPGSNGSGQSHSKFHFLPNSNEFYPESSQESGFGGHRSHSKSDLQDSTSGGENVDMAAYRRGLGMGGGNSTWEGSHGVGDFSNDTSGKYSSSLEMQGSNVRAARGGSGSNRQFENSDFSNSNGSGLSKYAGPSGEWMQGMPRSSSSEGIHSGGGRMGDYNHRQQQPQSWNHQPRQGMPAYQQQHIQQVHPRAPASHGGYGGSGNEIYQTQQQVISRYMDSGRSGDVHGGPGGVSKYMPRQGPGYGHGGRNGGRGSMGGGRGNGMNGRQGMQMQPQHQYHQNKYYDHHQPQDSQHSYGGYANGAGKPRNDRGYEEMGGSYHGASSNQLRGGSNQVAGGRVGLKATTRSGDIVRDVELEEVIYRNTQIILSETANKRLKSVELANALRDRIGKDYLARTKTLYGGLLVLLELHRETFRVQRVPKNDMVELLIPYRGGDSSTSTVFSTSSGGSGGSVNNAVGSKGPAPIQLVPEAMGLDSADIQKQQHARQLPGVGHWESSPVSVSASASSGSATVTKRVSPESNVLPTIQPSLCLYIREIPDDTNAAQIFADFGGNSIVDKVHINLEGTKRTGLIWFLTVSGALRALSIPLSSWRPFLSFHYPSDNHTFEFVEEANAASVARLCEQMIAMSLMPVTDCPSSPFKYASNGNTPSNGIASSPSFRSVPDVDMFNVFREKSNDPGSYLSSPNDDSNMLMWGDSQIKISGMSSEKPPVVRGNTPASSYCPHGNEDESDDERNDELSDLPDGQPVLTPTGSSLSERRPAPPPINTAFASDEQLLASRSPSSAISFQLTNSPNAACLSSPGTSEAFFAFQDENAPGGLSILSKDNLPSEMIAVMNTLCDVVYVPQKIWECSEAGDYPFVQVIVDILSVIFQNAFVQLTKLKQQVKKRLGGSIRIGPLKALLQAYPEHFEMDKNMTLVRSLKRELPLMNIKSVNLNVSK